MSNGSFERHLYPSHGVRDHGLDLIQLVNICCDVAAGVDYLHRYSPVKVVHCDLKPSNILLDGDMTSLIADFEIAKLVKEIDPDCNHISANDSISLWLTGLTALGVCRIYCSWNSMKWVNKLQHKEMSTVSGPSYYKSRARPTSFFTKVQAYGNWLNAIIHTGYNPNFEQAIGKHAPPHMLTYNNRIRSHVMLELIELGLLCTQYNPSTRPSMVDVANEMGKLKQYLSCPPPLTEEAALKSYL